MANPTLLELTQLVMTIQPLPKPFDWRVYAGEWWIVMGASRSGKNLLIQTLAGLSPIQSGIINLFGCDVATLKPTQLATLRSQLGVILENDGLMPAWSVFENLTVLLRYHGLVPASHIENYALDFLKKCQVTEEFLLRQTTALSPMESRWVSLFRALLSKPRLLLINGLLPQEPLHDEYDITKFVTEVINPMNLTIITNNILPDWLKRPQIHIALMQEGALLATGTPLQLVKHPQESVRKWMQSHYYV